MKLLLDACVLYPTVMREVLLSAAQEGMFEPLWSDRILEEWARAARKIGPDGEVQARAEIALLHAAWPRASVRVPQGALARLWLPDDNDVHVLAAAVTSSADAIITLNAKDFPRNILAEEGLRRLAPDELMMGFWLQEPGPITRAVERVHGTACKMMGAELPLRTLLKKARLPRLGKALG